MVIFLWLVLVLIGFIFGRLRWRRSRGAMYALALVWLLASSCGPLPSWLLHSLQAPYATRPDINWAQRNAIVVLGAGTSRVTETGQVEPLMFANGRIIEAYALYRACKQTGDQCKVIISGGDLYNNGLSEAGSYGVVMLSMGVSSADLVLESRSMNTWQNAQFVQPLLKAYQPDRIVLVTSALHLRRAQTFFNHFGIDTIPVRGDYAKVHPRWLPSAWNMILTDSALHEYLGILSYHLYNLMGWNAPPSRNGAV